MEEDNERASERRGPLNEDLYFSDGIRSIDFVLVYKENSSNELEESYRAKRVIFHKNLIEEGLEIEEDLIATTLPLKFVKLHAPIEVCTRYAEILKLRMPMKKKVEEAFLKKSRKIFRIPGIKAIEMNTPAFLLKVTKFFSKFFHFAKIDKHIFPP
ncbi:hypothetical protein Avbf_05057 [Armadillidium vulgare]|nr:hypothetical protein Avbf_05057 [Armadillidium vulgare]